MSELSVGAKDVMILFADLQPDLLKHSKTLPPARLKVGAAGLAKLAHIFDIPAVVSATDKKVIPEIAAALGAIKIHVRKTADAFLDPPTREAIVGAKRKTLLISGFTTEVVVQLSALSAVANGYQVQVVVDACGGLLQRTEDAAMQRMAKAGVLPTSVVALCGLLGGDFSTAKGQEAQKVLLEVASAG
jgi:Isochorismatase family